MPTQLILVEKILHEETIYLDHFISKCYNLSKIQSTLIKNSQNRYPHKQLKIKIHCQQLP